MPLAAIVFLAPAAALVGLAFLVPLAALAVRERAGARARSNVGLAGPGRGSVALRPLALVGLALLVAAAAAQPALRDVSTTPVRADVEMYLAFDVSRSMLASASPQGVPRLERARALGRALHEELREVPTGVATLTNRMMPMLFPAPDARGVTAVIDHSLRILQPLPAYLTAPRATQLAAIGLAADRSYFNPESRRRALVVLSDFDTDPFGLEGTLEQLRRHRIEPFLVRVAAPGERVFDGRGRPLAYLPASTMTVPAFRTAGWHAYEEDEAPRAAADVRAYLGDGAMRESGVVESQRSLAVPFALAALALAAALVAPALRAGLLARA